jgi:hypothetical protein
MIPLSSDDSRFSSATAQLGESLVASGAAVFKDIDENKDAHQCGVTEDLNVEVHLATIP